MFLKVVTKMLSCTYKKRKEVIIKGGHVNIRSQVTQNPALTHLALSKQ